MTDRRPDAPAIGLVRTASLFTRGDQSVRIVRVTRANEPTRLIVQGPDSESYVHTVDSFDGVQYEADIERHLVRQGYRLSSFVSGDRRSGSDRRSNPRSVDRRTHLERVI